jgi:hypothetical protein
MQSSNKHSTIKGLLLKLRAWSRDSLHNRPYKSYHMMHGRPDSYKDVDRASIRTGHVVDEPPVDPEPYGSDPGYVEPRDPGRLSTIVCSDQEEELHLFASPHGIRVSVYSPRYGYDCEADLAVQLLSIRKKP